MDQEVDIFIEEQRNPRTVKKAHLDVNKFFKPIQERPGSDIFLSSVCKESSFR